MNIELLLKEKLNNFEIYILVKPIDIKDPREVNSVPKTSQDLQYYLQQSIVDKSERKPEIVIIIELPKEKIKQ